MNGQRLAKCLTKLSLLAFCLGSTACLHATVRKNRGPHGDVQAKLKKEFDLSHRHKSIVRPEPLVVGVEAFAIQGLDPLTGALRWRKMIPVVGHPVANDELIFVPLADQRLAALERSSGERRWEISLPGEVVTGMDAAPGLLALTVTGGEGSKRNRLLLISDQDGLVRWTRASDRSMGTPAIVGRVVALPVGDEVLLFGRAIAWEAARASLPKGEFRWASIEVSKSSVVLGSERGWIDLLRGEQKTIQYIKDPYVPVFSKAEGFDRGVGDLEGLGWKVPISSESGEVNPDKTALFIARRAVLGVEISGDGRPLRAKWVYLAPGGQETVATDRSYGRVNLLDQQGGLTVLSDRDGRVLARVEGHSKIRGGLLLDLDRFEAIGDRAAGEFFENTLLSPFADVDEQLEILLQDPDPRLKEAQHLALDLSWRSAGPRGKSLVERVARGELRTHQTEERREIRRHALDYLRQHSDSSEEGQGTEEAAFALGFDPTKEIDSSELSLLAGRLVSTRDEESGKLEIVPELRDFLAERLLHPSTPAEALADIIDSLCEVGDEASTGAIRSFLWSYHADIALFSETHAIRQAAHCTVKQAVQGESKQLDQEFVAQILGDPFSDPGLLDLMSRTIDQINSDDQEEPEIARLSP